MSDRRAILWIALALLASCDTKKGPVAAPGPDDVVFQVGPVRLTDAQINRWIDWSKQRDPALSLAKIRRVTITDYWLPREIARGLAGQKNIDAARAQADRFYKALVAAGGDHENFRRIAKLQDVSVSDDEDFLRPFNQLPLDLTQALFETTVGSHSGVIESQLGLAVVAPKAKKFDTMERRQVLLATFPYDRDINFGATVRKASVELRNEKAYAHPRYRKQLDSVFRNMSSDWPPPTKPPHKTKNS